MTGFITQSVNLNFEETMKTGRIIAWLLALLGFAGCDTGGLIMYGPPDVVMYGPLRQAFIVKGAVTDADDKPLENIRVVLKIRDDEPVDGLNDRRPFRDTVYTDAKGEFQTDRKLMISLPLELIAADVDGAENGGEFESRSEVFNVINGNMDYEEGARVKRIDFTLTAKPQVDGNE